MKPLFVTTSFIELFFYAFWLGFLFFVTFWHILFTRRYPKYCFNYTKCYMERTFKAYCYYPMLLTDHPEPDDSHPLKLEVDYPDILSRRLLLLRFVISPFMEIGILVATVALFVVAIPAWWVILITSRYPRVLFGFNVNLLRWIARATAWVYFMRDEFPRLSTNRG